MKVDYLKYASLKFGKCYVATITLSGNGNIHLARRMFKTATFALKYGRRVAARYEQLKKAETVQ